jgi:hypothetical protein
MRESKGNEKGRLFIPAGIISLMLLPLLSLGYFYSQKGFEHYRILEFNTVGRKVLERMPPEFRPVLPERDYQLVELTGEAQADKAKLDYVQMYVRQLEARNDTLRGIRVVLKDQAEYASLVRVIDLPNVENLKHYWTDGKEFWFYSLPATPADDIAGWSFTCGFVEEPLSPPRYKVYRQQLAVLLQVPYLLPLFMVLLVISVNQLFSHSIHNKPIRSRPFV